ncbi:MAG: hypothetical protein QW095_06065 [Nitrososphaerota archaeon]
MMRPPMPVYPIYLVIHQKAIAEGKITLKYSGRLTPELALKCAPEYRSILEEIVSKGWRYLYIETMGRYSIELDLSGRPSRIIPYAADWYVTGRFFIDVELSKPLPELKVEGVDEFRINISTKNFPRAVTVDLAKQVITYIESVFWDWSDEWINDQEKLSNALEVYPVVKWLIEEKKFKLHENLSEERCRELLQKFAEYESKIGVTKLEG